MCESSSHRLGGGPLSALSEEGTERLAFKRWLPPAACIATTANPAAHYTVW